MCFHEAARGAKILDPISRYKVDNRNMQISELAEAAGVNVQTIRFYERRGMLREPPRTGSGYRCYSTADLEMLRVIRRSQELGFTLREIKQLSDLHATIANLPRGGKRPAEYRQMAQLARARLEQLEKRLRMMRAMRMQLLSLIDQLETVSVVRCPASLK
jgi:MerR family transcriptional regulator, mercuric resistance operon regulatory protein